MSEALATEGILKRLVEAELQANEILKTAQEQSERSLAEGNEQAKQMIEATRREMAELLRSRLQEVEAKAAKELAQRLEQTEARGREIERQAEEHFTSAVKMVVDWVTSRGE